MRNTVDPAILEAITVCVCEFEWLRWSEVLRAWMVADSCEAAAQCHLRGNRYCMGPVVIRDDNATSVLSTLLGPMG